MNGRKEGERVEEDVDRISQLPICLINEIFSFLPLKNVVATSVLSKRWRYQWTHVTHLDLRCLVRASHHYHKFFETVPKTLGGLTSQSIHTFVLQLMCLFRQEDCCEEGLTCAESWIDQICSRNVRVVDIQFVSPKIRLPARLFASHSLVNLSLQVPKLDFDLPEKIELPNLKYILLRKLYSGVESHDVLMRTLSKSCPALESLELEISLETDVSFDILGLNLKRLILKVHNGQENEAKVVINAPKLEYFEVTGDISSLFDFAMIPTELDTAKISIYYYVNELPTMSDDVRNMPNLLQGISNVRTLYLRSSSLSVLNFINSVNDGDHGLVIQLPLFRNLETLHLDAFLYSFKVSDWSGALPGCLLGKVKRVELSSLRKEYCFENKIKLLEHLLENAPALETLAVEYLDRYSKNNEEDECNKALSKLLSKYPNRHIDVE